MLPDPTMSFTQPAPPASASSSSPLAALGAMLPHAPYALPLSSLLGMKSIPYLALSTSSATAALLPGATAGAAAALASYTAKISTSNGTKKPERQKFSPY